MGQRPSSRAAALAVSGRIVETQWSRSDSTQYLGIGGWNNNGIGDRKGAGLAVLDAKYRFSTGAHTNVPPGATTRKPNKKQHNPYKDPVLKLAMKACPNSLPLAFLLAGGTMLAAPPDLTKLPAPAARTGLTYAADIRPLFEASCFRCHGEERPRGGLRVDSLEAVLKGGEDGKILTPGDSLKSKIVVAVAQLDAETAMPPKPGQGRGRGPGGRGGGGPGMFLAPQMLKQADKNADQKVSKQEFGALATAWFDTLDASKSGKISQEQFVAKFGEILPAPQRAEARPGENQNAGPGQGQGQPGERERRGPGGRDGFGPGRFLGPALHSALDADKDGALTKAEMTATFEKWFDSWDKSKAGVLTEGDIKDGLASALPAPNFGGRGGPGGPGGPGGNGGGGQGGPGGPGGFGGPPAKPLTAEQVALVRAWIDQGAK